MTYPAKLLDVIDQPDGTVDFLLEKEDGSKIRLINVKEQSPVDTTLATEPFAYSVRFDYKYYGLKEEPK